jgi:hypothetical protein
MIKKKKRKKKDTRATVPQLSILHEILNTALEGLSGINYF